MYYIASPYSHPDPAVIKKRFEGACRATMTLMRRGYVVFSPIAHSHAIENVVGESEGHDFWMGQDLAILGKCEGLIVLRLDGWDKSRGVAEEIETARFFSIPITYLDPGRVHVESIGDEAF